MHRPTSEDLGALPLFGGLPAEALVRFAERAELVHVDAGQVVFEEGEPARSLYVLTNGRLDVVKRCPQQERQRECVEVECSSAPALAPEDEATQDGDGAGQYSIIRPRPGPVAAER